MRCMPAETNMAGKGPQAETEEQQRLRFQVELEFVQCLANPNYLNFLAQRGYFKDQAFINYLKYLLYWKEPEYARYLKYPMCLYFLDLLQYEHFRREVVSAQCTKFIDDQQILLWQHYTRRRTRLLQTQAELCSQQQQHQQQQAHQQQQQQQQQQPQTQQQAPQQPTSQQPQQQQATGVTAPAALPVVTANGQSQPQKV